MGKILEKIVSNDQFSKDLFFSNKSGKYDKIVVKMDLWALENLCFSGKLLVDCNLAYFISIWKSDCLVLK